MRSGRTCGSPSGLPWSALLSISASSKRPRVSNDQGSTAAILAGVERLALRAVPRTAPAGACLLDRRAAPRAWLARAAVNPELVLHPPSAPLRVAVVAQGGALTGDAHLQRSSNGLAEPRDLVAVERPRRAKRMDPRPPQRLVRIDVPHSRGRSLVEESSLDRGAAPFQRPGERARGEAPLERLAAETPRREVVLQLPRLEESPRSETANVTIGDVRSIV